MSDSDQNHLAEAIADAVLDYLADQTYNKEPILHAIIACDFVSRQRMIASLKPIICKRLQDAQSRA